MMNCVGTHRTIESAGGLGWPRPRLRLRPREAAAAGAATAGAAAAPRTPWVVAPVRICGPLRRDLSGCKTISNKTSHQSPAGSEFLEINLPFIKSLLHSIISSSSFPHFLFHIFTRYHIA